MYFSGWAPLSIQIRENDIKREIEREMKREREKRAARSPIRKRKITDTQS
jgi:hypothetical protein